MKEKIKSNSLASSHEVDNRRELTYLLLNHPLPENEIGDHLGIFLKRQELSKTLFFNEIYQHILETHGVIMEFGCRWGQNLVTFMNLRGIHEPYNYNRKIIGFDTFQGFQNIHPNDGNNEIVREGNFSVTENYEDYLKEVLQRHENESPLSHISKFEIRKGDASLELKTYLKENPQTIISLAWFDFDIYTPTKKCLELIRPHLAKGAVLGFDELNDPKFPGETIALREFASLNSLKIRRNKFSGMQSYIIFE